jgi:hypothetical protein
VAEAASSRKRVVKKIEEKLHDVVREPVRESTVLGQGKVLFCGCERPTSKLFFDEIND